MPYPIHEIKKYAFPERMHEIPDPPEKLYIRGRDIDPNTPCLAVVGARKYSEYGRRATEQLIRGLSGTDIYIVSGLALGIDAIAHESALRANLKTIAVPGSGLDDSVLYPRSNFSLAQAILNEGGTLVSEFPSDTRAAPWCFPQRNRIMAGLATAVLVIECETRSGTLITARLATDYNRDVLTVPGSIFSPQSDGPHMLLRLGATPITTSEDILDALHIESLATTPTAPDTNLTEIDRAIIDLLPATRDEIAITLNLPIHSLSMHISSLELRGIIYEKLGTINTLRKS